HPQAHSTPIGELDRIGQQVQEDLAQPGLVGADSDGQVRREIADEVEPLLPRSHLDDLCNDAQEFGQHDVGAAELELARFNLGEIQDIVDQRQQLPAALPDHVQAFDVPFAQRLAALQYL